MLLINLLIARWFINFTYGHDTEGQLESLLRSAIDWDDCLFAKCFAFFVYHIPKYFPASDLLSFQLVAGKKIASSSSTGKSSVDCRSKKKMGKGIMEFKMGSSMKTRRNEKGGLHVEENQELEQRSQPNSSC